MTAPQTIRLRGETFDKLKKLKITLGWVDLRTHDEKVAHLVWLYEQGSIGKADSKNNPGR